MHMADALLSPAVGGSLWLASGGLLAHCARRVKASARDNLVPMMGVLGAFVFTAQMINFTIPGTGSSGHLGGGLLLAALLGPHAALIVIASVLTVQALFFADGGLMALGCNIFNLGFFPAFVAYPLLYRPLARGGYASARGWAAALLAAVVGLQCGALCVVLETCASGLTDLPFATFAKLMLPIHLAIGLVEGFATAAVVAFISRARPEALPTAESAPSGGPSLRPLLLGLLAAAVVTGGALSWFASSRPDGLEWSIAKIAGQAEIEGVPSAPRDRLGALQEKTAALPGYGFKAPQSGEEPAQDAKARTGTSVSGLVGGLLTLGLVAAVGLALRARRTSCQAPAEPPHERQR